MKTNFRAVSYSFGPAVCAVLFIASSARAQNLFEADDGTGAIYQYTPGGVRSALVTPLLQEAHDLAFDSSGNLFASVEVNGAYFIDKFTTSGTSVFASGLEFPTGLAFDSAGDLFVADTTAGDIYEYTPAGVRSTFATGLTRPSQLAFNSSGNLFVTDRIGAEITEITPGGVKSTFATGVMNPYGLAFNSAGDLFVGSQGADDIYEYTPGGVRSTFATGVDGPFGLAFNSAGNLFVVAAGAGDIYEYAPDGTRSTFFSGSPEFGVENIGLAFQGVSLPVPEPGAVALAGLGGAVLWLRRRK